MSSSFVPRLRQRILYFATHYTWAFAAIMALTVISCVFSIHYLSTLEADLRDVYENDVQGGDAVQAAALSLVAIESAAKDLFVYPDKKAKDRARSQIRTETTRLKKAMDTAVPRFYTPKAKQAFATTKTHLEAYLQALERFQAQAIPELKGLETLKARGEVMKKDFALLIANRAANSTKGISDLVFQLRLSLVVTLVIVSVTVVVRVVIYLAGHPRRRKTPSEN